MVGAVLGPTYLGNAFEVSNTLPNLVYYGFLAGSLTSAIVVPALVRHLQAGRADRVSEVSRAVLGLSTAAAALHPAGSGPGPTAPARPGFIRRCGYAAPGGPGAGAGPVHRTPGPAVRRRGLGHRGDVRAPPIRAPRPRPGGRERRCDRRARALRVGPPRPVELLGRGPGPARLRLDARGRRARVGPVVGRSALRRPVVATVLAARPRGAAARAGRPQRAGTSRVCSPCRCW